MLELSNLHSTSRTATRNGIFRAVACRAWFKKLVASSLPRAMSALLPSVSCPPPKKLHQYPPTHTPLCCNRHACRPRILSIRSYRAGEPEEDGLSLDYSFECRGPRVCTIETTCPGNKSQRHQRADSAAPHSRAPCHSLDAKPARQRACTAEMRSTPHHTSTRLREDGCV